MRAISTWYQQCLLQKYCVYVSNLRVWDVLFCTIHTVSGASLNLRDTVFLSPLPSLPEHSLKDLWPVKAVEQVKESDVQSSITLVLSYRQPVCPPASLGAPLVPELSLGSQPLV